MIEVRFYRSATGNCPVEDFLDSLSGKQAQKVIWVLRLFGELDTVPSEYFKKLTATEGIWEVRVRHGGNIFRLLGFLHGRDELILTHGFTKKTNRVPRQEIDVAEQRKKEFLDRSSHE